MRPDAPQSLDCDQSYKSLTRKTVQLVSESNAFCAVCVFEMQLGWYDRI